MLQMLTIKLKWKQNIDTRDTYLPSLFHGCYHQCKFRRLFLKIDDDCEINI